jgi:hypothetical protein
MRKEGKQTAFVIRRRIAHLRLSSSCGCRQASERIEVGECTEPIHAGPGEGSEGKVICLTFPLITTLAMLSS